jgi:hypothetical protein
MNMHRRWIFSIFAIAFIVAISLVVPNGASHAKGLSASKQDSAQQSATSRSPVLVELFTSEGCSDCPPADALLSALDARQPVAAADVIVLELHVTYWDGDWRDRFSSPAYTDRQHMYAFGRSGDQMYTPQMVVDGGEGFVGGNGKLALQAIEQAARAAKAQIHLEWTGAASGTERGLHVKVDSLPAGAAAEKPQIFLAITENHLHSNVRAGENSGKSLDHTGVVRKLSAIGRINPHGSDASFDSQTVVKLEHDWKPENLRAVVFLQNSHGLRVLGVAEIPY